MDLSTLDRAAEALAGSDALLVGAGAGMGVDSGLPDFRGTEGFWRAYPPLAKLGVRFEEMANPVWFQRDPELAWGFYGHRLHLYRSTRPHAGFDILRAWGESRARSVAVFTSNVDGQFQRAGFRRVVEVHGSLHHLQCVRGCGHSIWEANEIRVEIDTDTFRAVSELPRCPECGCVARPNVLMFGDWGWIAERSQAQEREFESWLRNASAGRLAVVECGAGTSVPTVRWRCQQIASALSAPLIRINPREPHGPAGTLSLAGGALEVLRAIDARLATV